MSQESRGQSLTEFALLLPILLLLMLGVVDVARAYAAFVTITNAAREGARFGIENPTATGSNCTTTRTIKYAVCREAASSDIVIDPNAITVACASPDGSTARSCSSAYTGDRIIVTVSYTYQFVTTYLFGVGSLTLSNSATMAITNGLTP